MTRQLDIGSGLYPVPRFETLDIAVEGADHRLDAFRKLPFDDNTFSVVHASQVLEHAPWYWAKRVLREWVRILAAGGSLEVWVPDALKICQAVVDYELHGIDRSGKDGWYKFNKEKNPYKWASSRTFTYGDGYGTADHPNWHRAMFTPKYLMQLFGDVGLDSVHVLGKDDVRNGKWSWIHLGVGGTKCSQ